MSSFSRSLSFNCKRETSAQALHPQFPVFYYPLVFSTVSIVLSRYPLLSPPNLSWSPRKTSALVLVTLPAQTTHLVLFFSRHSSYLATVVWDVLAKHSSWIPLQNLLICCHFPSAAERSLFQSVKPVALLALYFKTWMIASKQPTYH